MKRRLAVLVLAFTMVLTMGASVFAADPVTKNTGTTVYLTKQLTVPEGVAVPTEAFVFTATPVTDSGEVDLVSSGDYPTLSFGSITFGESDRVSATDTTLVKSSSVDIAGLTFPRAGLYEWKIKETAGSDSKITYDSNSEYKLRVYVKNGTSGRVVDTITVENSAGEKIDAGKEDKDINTDTDNDGNKTNDGNDFVFANSRDPQDIETNPTDPEGTKSGAFKLTKTTTGEFADKTHEFEFTVTVTFPTGTDTTKYTAAKKNGTATTVAAGENTVKLKDGDTWSIDKLPEGTKITVSEEATPHYTPSYTGKHTQGGAAVDLPTATAGKGEALAVGGNIVVGEKGANVAYTNTFDDNDVTPTGIIINNLPYVLLIGIALGGIVLFSRKRRYE